MGATHIRCINAIAAKASAGLGPVVAPSAKLPACLLTAVCDRDAARHSGMVAAAGNMASITTQERLFDPATVKTYAEPQDLFDDPTVHAVHICTHTDTHVDLAIRALEAGKHVLVEKPVAVTSADVQRVIDAASRADRLCMPAMCMRFWPGWPWVREKIVSREFGRVISATFHRLGTPPSWSPDFYRDAERTGGALVDLHIHDADFIRWCFGDPIEVISTGSTNHLTTVYRFETVNPFEAMGSPKTSETEAQRPPRHVVAEGGWGHSSGYGFRMRYTVAFEHATAEFDLHRTPTVLLYRNGAAEPISLPAESAYHIEIEHFVRLLARHVFPEVASFSDAALDDGPTLSDALAVARLLESERSSLISGHALRVRPLS